MSAHGTYHHQYHIVWIPKYRKKILKGALKPYVQEHLYDIQDFHPEIEIQEQSVQADHVHVVIVIVIVIPPKYSVSSMVGKIKANTSREIRESFEQVRRTYRGNVFWSPGFFSSTVGVNEDVIRRYVKFQEKVDKGQLQLSFSFQVPPA